MVDPVILMISAFCFGFLLITAGAHKLSNRSSFSAILVEYELVPSAFLPLAPLAIAGFELYLGITWVLLLLGVTTPDFARTTPLLTAGLLGLYALAMGINLARGRDYIDCGCGFGGEKTSDNSDNHQHLSNWLVFRNVLMAALALTLASGTTSRSVGIVDFVFTVLATIAIIFVYAAFNQLLLNRSTIASWRKANA